MKDEKHMKLDGCKFSTDYWDYIFDWLVLPCLFSDPLQASVVLIAYCGIFLRRGSYFSHFSFDYCEGLNYWAILRISIFLISVWTPHSIPDELSVIWRRDLRKDQGDCVIEGTEFSTYTMRLPILFLFIFAVGATMGKSEFKWGFSSLIVWPLWWAQIRVSWLGLPNP